jgi:hypothetical protein
MAPKSKGEKKSSRVILGHIANSSSLEPQRPFSRAPSFLSPLLTQLSRQHVYITSIDTKPRDFKVKIFAVPLLMNVTIIALLIWRLSTVGPYYVKILSSLTGSPNETTINAALITRQEFWYEVCRRTLTFMIDLLLYYLLWPWPRAFFIDQYDGNPIRWRVAIGFRDKEITIRRSRRWDENIGDVVAEHGEGIMVFLTNVRRATSWEWMHDRGGYQLLSKDWDLDWRLMAACTQMVDKREMSLESFRTTVLVYSKRFDWVIYQTEETGGSVKEGRKKILAFKNELTTMGKENLLFRWVELIQYESTQPGRFGPERQVEAMAKAKELFESHGVDFEKFWAKIGGMDNMSVMDLS